MYRRWMRSLFFLLLAIAGVPAAAADLSVDVGIEHFRWREFDAGARLLEETGPRLRVGAAWRQPLDAAQRDSLDVRGGLYFGQVNYDGQSQDILTGVRSPFSTDTNYVGAASEATFAHRLTPSSRGEVFVGGGIDAWRRDVRGRGNVSGTVENWTVFYLLAGGAVNWTDSAIRYRALAGLKYPFYTYQVTDIGDVALEPKGRLSLTARLATDFVRAGRSQWGLGVYYDSYRFARSDSKQTELSGIGTVTVAQPESDQDVIGVYAVVYLN